MGASTIYDIRLRYLLEDQASKKSKELDRNLRRVSDSSSGLGQHLKTMAASAAGFFGARAAKSALIDYNAGLEQIRTTMSGLLMTTTGADWTNSARAAQAIVTDMEQRAKLSTATTEEMAGFAAEVTQPLLAAGMAWSDIAEFSADALVAAKAFGDESIAAMDIQQALNQGVTVRDRFSKKLLGTLRMTTDEFNKMGTAQRLATLKGAISSPAIKRLGAEQATTFSGALSTFKDQLQIALGAVGLPLFQRITKEIAGWNKWIENNGDKMAQIGGRLSENLMSAFGVVKSVAGFFVENAETLIMIAKVWAGVKIGGMLGRSAAGMTEAMGRAASMFGSMHTTGGFGGIAAAGQTIPPLFNKLASGLGALVPVVGGVVMGFKALSGLLKRDLTDAEKKRKMEGLTAVAAVRRIGAAQAERAKTIGRLGGTAGLTGSDLDRALGIGRLAGGETRAMKDRAAGFRGAAPAAGTADSMALMIARDLKAKMDPQLREAQAGLLEWALANNYAAGTQKDFAFKVKEMQGAVRDQLQLSSKEWADMAKELTFLERDIRAGRFSLDEFMRARVGEAAPEIPMVPQVADDASSKPKVNVTIQRIEVRSDDPDRFVFQLQSAVEKIARDPSAARSMPRLG